LLFYGTVVTAVKIPPTKVIVAISPEPPPPKVYVAPIPVFPWHL